MFLYFWCKYWVLSSDVSLHIQFQSFANFLTVNIFSQKSENAFQGHANCEQLPQHKLSSFLNRGSSAHRQRNYAIQLRIILTDSGSNMQSIIQQFRWSFFGHFRRGQTECENIAAACGRETIWANKSWTRNQRPRRICRRGMLAKERKN